MTCYYCPLSENISGLDDIKVVTLSMPPKIRCTRTNEYHDLYHKCEFEFDIVKHGHWDTAQFDMVGGYYTQVTGCSCCGWTYDSGFVGLRFCPNCGAKMDETVTDGE